MYVEEFPYCCGAHILCDFGWNKPTREESANGMDWSDGDYDATPSLESLGFEIDRAIRNYVPDIPHPFNGAAAFLMAILTPSQVEKVGPLLKERGFKVKGTGNNGEHFDKKLTMYIYCRKVKKGKKK